MRSSAILISILVVAGSGLAQGQDPVPVPVAGSGFVDANSLSPEDQAIDASVEQAQARPGAFPGALQPTTPGTASPTTGPRSFAPLAASTSSTPLSAGDGGAADRALANFNRTRNSVMIGDMGPPGFRVSTLAAIQPPAPPPPFPPNPPPTPPSPRLASALVPSVRGFKIGENQSPQPQDRFFYSFNYFSNVNGAVNKAFESPVDHLKVYREIFGFEKTFNEGFGSVGLRLPLNTLSGDSNIQGNFKKPGGTSTAPGDLSIFAKYVLKVDPATGSLFSVGFVVTPPTGPSTFASSKFIQGGFHTTALQPFIGYIVNRGNFYLHGFTAFDAPVNPNDVMLFYSDTGIGYYVFRADQNDRSAFLTAVVPTFEVHCNIPLNHRGAFNKNDISGSADVVNLTSGVNFEFNRQSVLTIGIVNPVTSPRPFDLEALVLFNFRFGASRTRPQNLPILGG